MKIIWWDTYYLSSMVDPETTPARPKPTPQQVYKLMEEFTRLDYLMAETLLMQTEEDLKRYLADRK